MDWADELAARVSGPQVVNDSKTPSGTVHVGSLRGPVILDVIARALRANGHETTLLYGVDDMDPMDAQALLTPDAIDREMGRPLAHVPDPAGDCHASYARHFAGLFIDIFAGLGIHPDRYYWMSDIYPTGAMDPYIRLALDRAALVREIYRRVANVQHPETWHPLGVVCPTCGKVGTTIVTKWDGERVFFECRADLVTWARGCGSSGWISPFGGAAKLPWNLEWAAQWSLFGVTIEPGGKDLSTAGGSRDRSDAIAREVFEREPPLNVPYEFLNIPRQEDVDLAGAWRGGAHDRRGHPARTAPLPVPAPAPEPGDRVRPGRDRRRPAALRRVRPVRGGDRRAARSRARSRRATRRRSATRCSTRTPTSRPRRAPSGRPSRTWPSSSRSRASMSTARVEAEKGSPLTERERAILDERVAAAARAWLEAYAPGARAPHRPSRCPAGRGRGARGRPARLPGRAGRDGRYRGAVGRGCMAGRDLRRRRGHGPACRSGVRRALPGVPRTDQRTARRLAAGQSRSGVRPRAAARWRGRATGHGGGCRMSVGLQRLRDEPEAIRDGAIRKGEDPALVDRALELDAERRRLLAESETLKAERNAASKQIGEAIKAGAAPDGPEVADLRAALHRGW